MYKLKGKFVSEKKLNTLLKRQQNLRKAREVYQQQAQSETETSVTRKAGERRKLSPQPADETDENSTPKRMAMGKEYQGEKDSDCGRGRRIVEISELAKHLWCCSCAECLSLDNVEDERRQGLGSVFSVRCHKCAVINLVPTGKKHEDELGRKTLFDINAKIVMGVINGGMHYSQMSTLFAAMNMPNMTFQTYKKYERRLGVNIEQVAKESCEKAAEEERELTIQNRTSIEQILPEHLQTGFIVPQPSPGASTKGITYQPVTFDQVVRILVSYDMGWSKRGAGRNYDSLNGYGAIIGNFSGKVLDYNQCNRKCSMCDAGHPPSSHDCRLNYYGSAKGMEAHTAKKLVTESNILKGQNLEVGVLITDEDSSSIAACRSAASHEIIRQSDMNHASKGVKTVLYKIEKSHGEINFEAIMYLHRCFTYALAQNKGNSAAMATALRSIPLHAFNDHAICGSWCGFLKDPENYNHRVIHDGFTDPELKEALIDVFNKLADNANKFAAAASSNSNESLNSMMARKCPKNTCLSMSESADFRFGAVVAKKNLGEGYTQRSIVAGNLSPGSPFHSRHVAKTDNLTEKYRSKYNSKDFKLHRISKNKRRANIKNRRELFEGTTYESNCNLLANDGVATLPLDEENIDNDWLVGAEGEGIIILFDLETSGFPVDADILQIGARFGNKTFNVFIKPSKSIPKTASDVHGLTFLTGDLFQHGVQVEAVTLQVAVREFINFLVSFGKGVYLCAHNCFSFDWPRIMRAIETCGELNRLQPILKGLIDSLTLVKKNRPNQQNKLGDLAKEFNISLSGAHDAVADVTMLHLILQELNFSAKYLIDNSLNIWLKLSLTESLGEVLSADMIKKFTKAGITLQSIREAFDASQLKGISLLLKPVTKHKATLAKIAAYFDKENALPSTCSAESNKDIIEESCDPVERHSSPDLMEEYLPNNQNFSQALSFEKF